MTTSTNRTFSLPLTVMTILTMTPVHYAEGADAHTEKLFGQQDVCLDRNACNPIPTAQGTFVMTARAVDQLAAIRDFLAESKTLLSNIDSQSKTIAQQTKDTQDTLKTMVKTFNEELRSSITTRFNQLPQEFIASPAIRQLKEDIFSEVDKRITEREKP